MSQVINNNDPERIQIAAQLAQNLVNFYQGQRSQRNKLKSLLTVNMATFPDRYKGAEVTVTPEGFEDPNQAFLDSFFSPLPKGSKPNEITYEDFPFNKNNDALKMYQESIKKSPFYQTAEKKGMELLGIGSPFGKLKLPEIPKLSTDTPDSKNIPDISTLKTEDEPKLVQYFKDMSNSGLTTQEIINKFSQDTGFKPSNEQANRLYQENKDLFVKTKKDKNNPLNQILDPIAGFKKESNTASSSEGYHVNIGEQPSKYTEKGKRSVIVTETPGYSDYFNDPSYRAMQNTAGILSILGDTQGAEQMKTEADKLANYLISRNQGSRKSIQTIEGPEKTLETKLPSINIGQNESQRFNVYNNTSMNIPGNQMQEESLGVASFGKGIDIRFNKNGRNDLSYTVDLLEKSDAIITDVKDNYGQSAFSISGSDIKRVNTNEVVAKKIGDDKIKIYPDKMTKYEISQLTRATASKTGTTDQQ